MAYEAEKIAGAEMLVRLVNEAGDPPDLIVQAGVGYGHIEVPILRAAWPDAKWMGFEPNGETLFTAKHNYPGDLYQAALSNRRGYGRLKIPTVANRASLFSIDGAAKTIPVDLRRLDETLRRRTGGDRILLWLDCEGSELDALEGAGGWIGNVIAVNVELWDKSPTEGWPDGKTIDAWLTARGFRCAGHQILWHEYGIRDAVYLREKKT